MSAMLEFTRRAFVHLLVSACLCLFFAAPVCAQNDLSTITILQPVSGCALSATENVTIRLFNFGPTLVAGTSFNVAYTINSGVPTTELVTLSTNLLGNSSFNYTFTTRANLSTPGFYTFAATVSLAGDVNPTNDAFSGYVVESVAASNAGTLSGPSSGSTGVLTVTGNTGAIVQWEESPDAQRWFKLANTTTTQSFSGLNATTHFRARVANGACGNPVSNVVTVVP